MVPLFVPKRVQGPLPAAVHRQASVRALGVLRDLAAEFFIGLSQFSYLLNKAILSIPVFVNRALHLPDLLIQSFQLCCDRLPLSPSSEIGNQVRMVFPDVLDCLPVAVMICQFDPDYG